MKKVGIILGSDSDLPVAKKAVDVLRQFGIDFEIHIYSAHRTPEKAKEYAANARKNGIGVIIGMAGMAAHLAGALAANTTVPVIGVPCASGAFQGWDSLLSTVQMPTGIPVATVAVNGGANAALLAAQILSLSDEGIAEKLDCKRASDSEKVLEKDRDLDISTL
jgi:5-(carboxyamino)imidazole ribonucleotide mutase